MPCNTATQQIGYAFLPTGLVCVSDSVPVVATHAVSASPSVALHVEPGPTQLVPSGPALNQPVPTMNDCTHTVPRPALHVPMMNKCAHATMNEHTLAMPGPTMPTPTECVHTMSTHTMPAHIGPTHAMPHSTMPMYTMTVHTGPVHSV